MTWIHTKHALPRDRQYVLVIYNGGNWGDSDDQDRVNYKVAKFRKGVTEDVCKKRNCYGFADQHGNNLVPYRWDYGAGDFFGQDVTWWMELEGPPK